MTRRSRITLCIIGICGWCSASPQQGNLLGNVTPYALQVADTVRKADQEKRWEARFRSLPEPSRLKEYMRHLSARPHNVGSPFDRDNAEWILARYKEWGFDAHIEVFSVLYPTPKLRRVELVEPTTFVASLKESGLSLDPTSVQEDEQLPTYNAYSADGDVTAPLVYVNYGLPDDYKELERLGISVKGAIVIVRYGASWRGVKPKVAAEHGAVGCLIYTDPRGDGFFEGEVFPTGAWRPPDGVQRGSVMDMPLYPGDPLTPGIGATENAKRLSLKEVKTFTTIPVLPISSADAKPLLAALGGPVVPEGWRGSLPLTYRMGKGPAKVHLQVESNWDMKNIYDVVATIPGSTIPGEWIIRGNHHDAWVNGAEDPTSGQVALLEEARSLGALTKMGWKPKRTIIYCSWDGEEPGLIGSTEWVETHADELLEHAVAYINTDANGRGYLNAGGSHALEQFLNNVMRDIEDPETHLSVWKREQLHRIARADSQQARTRLRSSPDLDIDALGSGSDYTAFLDHLGVASLNLGYGGEDGGGIYHSIYDDFYWYTHFSDTAFVYGRALAQTVGTAVIRLADAHLLPFQFTGLASAVRKYLREVQKLLGDMREEISERNTEIKEGVFAAIADPRKTLVAPGSEDLPPQLNFGPLEHGVNALQHSAEHYDRVAARYLSAHGKSPEAVNRKLIQSERRLTDAGGLPGRPWFRHLIYAPGMYTGYGVKTLPAVREAIEQKDWNRADAEIQRTGNILGDEAALVDSAAVQLEHLLE